MKASDLVKSLVISNLKPNNYGVVTLYKGQGITEFLRINFGNGRVISFETIQPLTHLNSQNFFVVYGSHPLMAPGSKCPHAPNCVYKLENSECISLYKFDDGENDAIR